jgi:L,D-peptidoglycan transpeptidase YkuD (ErfK/YbiS/YcfS/YnhG family)
MHKIKYPKVSIVRSIFVLMVLVVFAGIVFFIFVPLTPDVALKNARENLAAARNAHADRYAGDKYELAGALYDSAMVWWRYENRRIIFFRDYSKVILFADSSAKVSSDALDQAAHNARNARNVTGASFESLQENVKRIGKMYGSLPLSDEFRDNYNKARLLLEETRIARKKGEFHKAAGILDKAQTALVSAETYAENRINDYFNHFPEWEKLFKQALAASVKNRTTLIVVDKMAHELMLFVEGKLKSTFTAEFGPNWIGDKNHQGDQATPEGSYLVVKKKERRQTRYYKALLLNYPNREDMQRYKNSVKRGVIPAHIDVGGLIEIHGHGNQGFNWTNGCVALSDRDMDILYRLTSVNTPVIIVGSLLSRDEWEKSILLDSH